MENILSFYYNLNIDNINKINNNYYFNYQNNNYVFHMYERHIKEIEEIYELNEYLKTLNIPVYEIIITRENSLLVEYNNDYYVLMKIPKIKNRTITYNDLKINIPINKEYKLIDKSNWSNLWQTKIDYIEKEFFGIKNKYQEISKDINYYIGLWENALSYYEDNVIKNTPKSLSIRRLNIDTDILTILNPLEFVIDHKERALGDYLKSFVMNKNYTKDQIKEMVLKFKLNKNNIMILISRILFPSYYFDKYESIINDKANEISIKEINNKNVIELINVIYDIYKNYNIPIIYWIKKEE